MTTVRETIPEDLAPEVEAALAWFNGSEDIAFEVTGIVDPEAAPEASGWPAPPYWYQPLS